MADRKYGARVYHLEDDTITVKQTVKSDERYVIDGDKERIVDWDDDAAVAGAVRDALAGKLTK